MRGAECQWHRGGRAGFLHVQPVVGAFAVVGQDLLQLGDQFGRQGGARARIYQHAFGGNGFGIDNMVAVEQDLEIVYKATLLKGDRISIHQMPGLDQKLGPANADMIGALIDKQPMIGADQQVVFIVQNACSDPDRSEIAYATDGAVADPADFLHARVARQHAVTGFEVLDWDLRAGSQRDMRAA